MGTATSYQPWWLFPSPYKIPRMKEVFKRAGSPTPAFFRRLRNTGLTLTSISATVLTRPELFPANVVAFAGYVAVGGAVLSAVCQLVKENEQ